MKFLKAKEQKDLMYTPLHLSYIFKLFSLMLLLVGIHLQALSIVKPVVQVHHTLKTGISLNMLMRAYNLYKIKITKNFMSV